MIITPSGSAGDYVGTHIRFTDKGPSASGKTSLWAVESNHGDYLGHVQWFARWRKYAFYPYDSTIYEETCLNEIAEFIKLMTKQHREGA